MRIKIYQEGKVPIGSGNVGVSVDDGEFFREGKLLAEMLENRAFEEGLAGYSPYPETGGAEIRVSADRPLFPETPHYLRVSTPAGGRGFENRALGGIRLTAGVKYEFSFYARSYDYRGKVALRIFTGNSAFEKKFPIKPDGKWHKYVFRRKARRDCTDGRFAIVLSSPGTLHFDWLSFYPLNAIKGIFRRDVFETLKDFKPGFLRFSGGAWLKDTLAPEEQRRRYPTRAGFYELLRFCEALCCKPLPVLKFSGKEGEEKELSDICALLEFALGGAETEWGSLRAEMGHPQPFALEYLSLKFEEDAGGVSERIAGRLHEKYPNLNLIAPEKGEGEKFDHFYAREEELHCSPDWLLENAHRYDKQPRGRRLIVSFAATERGALAEAAFMTGVERNADLITGTCRLALTGEPAYGQLDPLLQIDRSGITENPGLSVQKLFSLYTGSSLLKAEVEGAEGVYASATEREGGLTFVKIVNASDAELDAQIEGDERVGEINRIVLMQEDPKDGSVVPFEIAPTSARSLKLPPRSFSVIVLR